MEKLTVVLRMEEQHRRRGDVITRNARAKKVYKAANSVNGGARNDMRS